MRNVVRLHMGRRCRAEIIGAACAVLGLSRDKARRRGRVGTPLAAAKALPRSSAARKEWIRRKAGEGSLSKLGGVTSSALPPASSAGMSETPRGRSPGA